jgi:hypothetical protein
VETAEGVKTTVVVKPGVIVKSAMMVVKPGVIVEPAMMVVNTTMIVPTTVVMRILRESVGTVGQPCAD